MFIVVKRDGDLKPSTYPEIHETLQSAEKEAARLSDIHIGKEFIVFGPITGKLVLPGSMQTKNYGD